MPTILIFVKAPIPGEVKTRLAAGLGATRALELYKAMAIDTVKAARAVRGSDVLIAYDGKNPRWLSESLLSWFKQSGKDLGARLVHAVGRVFREKGGPVVVIGSDLPSLTPKLLSDAFRALKKASVVIGPSRDGGYYLIGLRAPQPQLFQGITWSSPKVLRQTIAAVKKSKLSYRMLQLEQDIDTMEDLVSYCAQ